MSQLMKWVTACGIGLASAGIGMTVLPSKAAADDVGVVVRPAVQTTVDQTLVPVQQVTWRNGWGPRARVWGPGVGVYVGPRYYGGYYGPYRAYRYGYAYPAYGYGPAYGPAYGWYGW